MNPTILSIRKQRFFSFGFILHRLFPFFVASLALGIATAFEMRQCNLLVALLAEQKAPGFEPGWE